MLRVRGHRAALLAGVAGLAVSGSIAMAQDRTWNGGTGSWGTAANWNLPDVPDTYSERGVISAPGTYIVTISGSYNLGGVLVSNPDATLNIDPGQTQRVNADITNNGTIVFNDSGANAGSQIILNSAFSLLGTGQLVMNANPANLDTAYFYWNGGGEVLTNGAAHTIRGTGNMYPYFTNLGTVNADRAGLVLNFRTQPKSNAGTMKATNGGTLRFDGVGLTQTGAGTLLADGGTVQLNSVSESGGTLTAMPGSQVQCTGTSYVGNAATNGTLAVVAGSTVRMTADIQNNGTILVNDSGANAGSQWLMNSSATLNGPGDLLLNANPANLDSAYIYWNGGGETLTNASTHLIHGAGNIYCYLTNNGTIRADASGKTLQLTSQPKTNNNLITAVNGANLAVTTCAITQAGGTMSAIGAGSTVTLTNAGVTGGTVSASGGGVVNTNNNTFDSVTLSGPVNVLNGTLLAVSNALTNNGTLSINPPGANSATWLRVNNSLTLNGTGTLVLNANPVNLDTSYIYWNGGGEVLTHGAGHTIRGTGNIYPYLVNNGTISADVSGQTLQLTSQPKTNNSVIRAINGANLSVLSCTVTQNSPGSLTATGAGSTLSFTSAGVSGGLVAASGGGVTILNNSTLTSLVLSGPAQMPAGTSNYFNTSLTNNGSIVINPTGGNSGTWFRPNNNATIDGTGEIVLNANALNLDTAYLTWNGGGEVLTLGANHTVRGTGRIYVSFDNLGAIRADATGKVLEIISGQGKTNENLIQAENGGTLSISGVNLTQTASGQIRAQGGTVSIVNSNITGGSFISNSNSDLFNISGTVTVGGIYAATQMRVNGGATLRAASSFTNACNIVVSSIVQFLPPAATVDGPGRFFLNATPATIGSAYLTWNGGGEVFTNGPQHTVAGTGTIYVRTLNQGTLSPGNGQDSIGQLDARSIVTCAPSGVVEIEIGGPNPTDFDRITGPAAWTIDGTLRVSTTNGFVPGYGTTYDIITYGSHTGAFAAIDGYGWTVQYLPDRVRLIAVCDADVNQDGNADQGDVDYLINVVAGGDNPTNVDPDFNRDGNVDQGDGDALINAVAGGGCN